MPSSLESATYFLDPDGFWRAPGLTSIKAPFPQAPPVRVRLNRLHAKGGVVAPPDTNPVGYLPPVTAADITLMLAGTHPVLPDAVTFASLQGSDTVTTTTDADGGQFRAFASGQFMTILRRVPAGKAVIFDTGTYEVNEPNWASVGAGAGAVRWPKPSPGGFGRNPPGKSWSDIRPTTVRTVIRVKPNTGPAVNVMPAWFQCGYDGSVQFHFANIHFEGTEQGFQTAGGGNVGDKGVDGSGTNRRLFTNWYAWKQQPGSTMRDCLGTGSFGNNGAPPGETFNFEWYHSTDGKACRIYSDGRRSNNNVIYSAVGWTFGNSINCTLSDSWMHHGAFAGYVHFKTINCRTYSMVLGDPNDHVSLHTNGRTKGDWLNHELHDGTEHWDLVLNCYSVGGGQVAHITHSNGVGFSLDEWRTGTKYTAISGNGTLKLVDVKWSNIIRSGRLGIETWVPYGGVTETIGPPNYPQVVYRSGAKIPGVDWKYDSAGTWVTIQ